MQLPSTAGSLQSHPVTAPSRQYQTQTSPSRDAYYSQQNASSPTTQPSPSRRSTRRPSNGTAPTTPLTPQQPQFYSPSGANNNASSSSTTPRGQPQQSQPLSPAQSPVGNNMSYEPYYAGNGQSEREGGPPIPPPPRTSSNQRGQGTPTQTFSSADRAIPIRQSTRRADERPSSSRTVEGSNGKDRGNGGDFPSGSDREKAAMGEPASAAAAAARQRRRAPQSPTEGIPTRASSNRDGSSRPSSRGAAGASTSRAVTQNTSKTGAETPPRGPTAASREGNSVASCAAVLEPHIDTQRELYRMEEIQPYSLEADKSPTSGLGPPGNESLQDGASGSSRTRQDNPGASRKKEIKFGEYILGNTLGEGEFGKVKMGWKKGGGVEVAIKLIRRETLGSNPSRLPKIYREISILREISHPNIVRLFEMVETDRHIGIILEYASGGELFDFILNHRYLKDNAARRLFAQLISGVGYLHKKGIVHRDLKLENLLLDKNRNIIITDFGFANTFDPADELGDEVEFKLNDKEFVKRRGLDKILDSGLRRGDLMATSCGSPCYAAPELVVSDSLYTGRKVDVWSCGVILYAMLAGYLPFDDDPANPEGDNINLLYKYIVSTPLTFPEYVTPHARDLLRRILVPDPRKRADLFEVARHSWLSEYANVVGFITSSVTTTGEIADTTVAADGHNEGPLLARSASVREPSKAHQANSTTVGGLSQKHGNVDPSQQSEKPKTQRDNKRRTVQVEYVPPHTKRDDTYASNAQPSSSSTVPIAGVSRPRTRGEGQETSKSSSPRTTAERVSSSTKPLPRDPPESRTNYQKTATQGRPRPTTASNPPVRPAREPSRSMSDNLGSFALGPVPSSSMPRPNTSGSLASSAHASYSRPGQPVAPTVAAMNAQGRLAQPSTGKPYVISNPILQEDQQQPSMGRPSASAVPPRLTQNLASNYTDAQGSRGHKRSNTVGGIFGRTASMFSGRASSQQTPPPTAPPQKSYPPMSMASVNSGPATSVDAPRQSSDSRRSVSFGFGRKTSGPTLTEKPRRFSLLPASFSLRNFGSSHKDQAPPPTARSMSDHRDLSQNPVNRGRQHLQPQSTGLGRAGQSRSTSSGTANGIPASFDGPYDSTASSPVYQHGRAGPTSHPQQYTAHIPSSNSRSGEQSRNARPNFTQGDSQLATESESSIREYRENGTIYPQGFNEEDDQYQPRNRRGPGVLQKNQRKFTDAYEQHNESRIGAGGRNSGSSGAARKVMDFFRRRGKARDGDDG
ncbi:MAG: hypothetical protein M1829_002746 [Trizodia sp. TS-e1964]|nr:MAG: hypothetical protein M1829_002746 [Trizodia sp. TS-e1964]